MSVHIVRPGSAVASGLYGLPAASISVIQRSSLQVPSIAREEPGDPVELGGALAYEIALCPERTSPGVVMAVRIPGWGAPVLLRPGEVLSVPEGVSRFWCWNALGKVWNRAISPGAGICAAPLGQVAFLVSTRPGEGVLMRRDLAPRGAVSLVGYMKPVPATPLSMIATSWTEGGVCVLSGLALARFTFQPYTAGGAPIDVPVDFAGTVRLYVAQLAWSTPGAPISEDDPLPSGSALTFWRAVDGADMVLGPNASSFVRTPPAGAIACALVVSGLAGTAVASIACYVEAAG